MRSQIKALTTIILCVAAGVALGIFSPRERATERAAAPAEPLPEASSSVSQTQDAGFVAITMGDMTFRAQVADTDESRMRGLSGRPSLAADEAMLFVFPYASTWGIWMKDMLFSIDVVWADAEGRIVSVKERVAPETYPEAFYPSEPAFYVVELPAGSAAKHGIAPGGKIIF